MVSRLHNLPDAFDWHAGEGFIFATGAPGSRWSGLCHFISLAEEIDNSDETSHRQFRNHFGNYFGPGMEHGHRFDQLPGLSKDEILLELAKPFSAPVGHQVRLIKSHCFSRHLDFIASAFPKAQFLLVYRTDEECLDWWLRIGGFDITYPNYSCYTDVAGIRQGIAEENAAILDFARRMDISFNRLQDEMDVLPMFGLTFSQQKAESYAASIGKQWDDVLQQRNRLAPSKQVAFFRPYLA